MTFISEWYIWKHSKKKILLSVFLSYTPCLKLKSQPLGSRYGCSLLFSLRDKNSSARLGKMLFALEKKQPEFQPKRDKWNSKHLWRHQDAWKLWWGQSSCTAFFIEKWFTQHNYLQPSQNQQCNGSNRQMNSLFIKKGGATAISLLNPSNLIRAVMP